MGDKKNSKSKIIQNNIYILKLLYSICKSRVIHTALSRFLFYFEWIFYSGFLIRYVIKSVEEKQGFPRIRIFLIIIIVIFCLLSIYNNYVEYGITPLTDTIIYKNLYKKLYQKATNVEIECFENSEFYNKYTLALESANNNIWSIFFGGIAAMISFYVMYEIDHYAILFVISPIIEL